MAHLLLFLGLLAGIFAQDTHYCPDGWSVSEMDEGNWSPEKQFLKQLVSQADGRGQPGRPGMQWDSQWWLGAMCYGEHGSHNWGDWKWDHSGADIAWYDWMRNEPNDFRTQNCLSFLKDQDIFGYGVYHWNDWDCAATARFICERAPISTKA